MENLPKLLVLSTSLPGTHHGGGVVQDEILQSYSKDRYICFALTPPAWQAAGDEIPASLQGVPWQVAPLLPPLNLRGARFYLPVLRIIAYMTVLPWRIRQAVAFGRQHGVELVWGEFQSEAVLLTTRVARELEVPLAGTVWDDPSSWLPGFDRLAQQLLKARFQEALFCAQTLSTAGEAMQRAYTREYGVKSVILRHGFAHPVPLPESRSTQNGIVIGFVGSVYGLDAWEAFLKTVTLLNTLGTLPTIRLRVFGGGTIPRVSDGVEIENWGWHSPEVMLRELAATDFCYLPYWFDPAKRRHVELSFPNKFETYLAAGRPVFYHGPEYAGIASAVQDYGVGLCVSSLDQDVIASALTRLIQEKALRRSFEKAALSAFRSEFNAEVMLANFAQLIGVSPELLAWTWPGFFSKGRPL
jgi:glycosyltransferase involved in cell wall biosynthesis